MTRQEEIGEEMEAAMAGARAHVATMLALIQEMRDDGLFVHDVRTPQAAELLERAAELLS